MPNPLGGSVLVCFFLDAGGTGFLCALVFRSGVPVARLFCLIELKTGVPRGRGQQSEAEHIPDPKEFEDVGVTLTKWEREV